MRYNLHKLINVTSITVAPANIVSLPINIIDLVGNVGANDIILFDFFESQMWVVNANKDNARAVRFVNKHFVVEFRCGNFPVGAVNIKENFLRASEIIVKFDNSISSSVNVDQDFSG